MTKLNSFSTAIEALNGQDLTGKVALVTGGNQGIGVETVRALAYAGAKVYFTSRSIDKGEEVATEIREKNVKGSVHVVQLDLNDLESIHQLSQKIMSNEKNLHYLICNAGIMAKRAYTKYGFELNMATNHYGHFALVSELLDFMVKQDVPARIVIVASEAYRAGEVNLEDLNHRSKQHFKTFYAYASSKQANILYSKALAQKVQGTKVKVYSLHPGGMLTQMASVWFGQYMFSIVKYIEPFVLYWLVVLSRGELKTLEQGAATTIYATTAPELETLNGTYLKNCAVSDVKGYAKDIDKANKLYSITE